MYKQYKKYKLNKIFKIFFCVKFVINKKNFCIYNSLNNSV